VFDGRALGSSCLREGIGRHGHTNEPLMARDEQDRPTERVADRLRTSHERTTRRRSELQGLVHEGNRHIGSYLTLMEFSLSTVTRQDKTLELTTDLGMKVLR
jgi:hypothetical protein